MNFKGDIRVVSEELIVLKEYIESLGFDPTNMSMDDLINLKNELKNAGEFGLARLVSTLNNPGELLEYVGEE